MKHQQSHCRMFSLFEVAAKKLNIHQKFNIRIDVEKWSNVFGWHKCQISKNQNLVATMNRNKQLINIRFLSKRLHQHFFPFFSLSRRNTRLGLNFRGAAPQFNVRQSAQTQKYKWLRRLTLQVVVVVVVFFCSECDTIFLGLVATSFRSWSFDKCSNDEPKVKIAFSNIRGLCQVYTQFIVALACHWQKHIRDGGGGIGVYSKQQ